MSTQSCVHDWRHIQTIEAHQYDPVTSGPSGPTTVTIHDEWYCTKCRLVERTERGTS